MGGERHPDGVSTQPASVADLASFRHASEQLRTLSAPVLHDGSRPADRLFVASFDGVPSSPFAASSSPGGSVPAPVSYRESGGRRCEPLSATMGKCWSLCGEPFPRWLRIVYFSGEFLDFSCLGHVPNWIKVSFPVMKQCLLLCRKVA